MAVQEAVEQLERLFDSDEAMEDNDARPRDDCTSLAGKFKLNSPITQLTILIDLYGSCKFRIGWFTYPSECRNIALHRMKLRRRSAPDALRPLLKELQAIIQLAVPTLTTQDGRAIISGVTLLCQNTAKWAETIAGDEHEDTRLSKVGNSPQAGTCVRLQ